MAGSYETSSEYIKHHLTNLTYGQKADGSWGILGYEDMDTMGFWSPGIEPVRFH